MEPTIRRLVQADDEPALKLWAEAFGDMPAGSPPRRWSPSELQGRTIHLVDQDGTLIGAIIDREYLSWFGGVEVPTAGIAGVTVRAEERGTGLLSPLFDACLTHARERGALVSTMFPTAGGIYRKFGYEVIGALEDLEVPTADLAVKGDTVPVRRASVADVPAIRDVYSRWASGQHGPLTRTGPSFPTADAEFLDDFTGITVAEANSGTITGYASWKRGEGYGDDGKIRVADLIADDRASMVSLMRSLSGHAAVAPTTVIRTSGFEPWRLLLRSNAGKVVGRDPYGLAVLDVQAFSAVRYPIALDVELPFTWRENGYVLILADGAGHVESAPTPTNARTFTDAALALTFAGTQSSAAQRSLGLLHGTQADDTVWDALSSRQFAIRDYF